MVKNCSAVGCNNVFQKGSGISFHRFPTNLERKQRWIAALRRENWTPTESTWICSQHFVTGKKSNNRLAPNYVPSIFEHVSSPDKRRLENDAVQFERRQAMKRRRRTAAGNSRPRRNTRSRRNATVTPTVVLNRDVSDDESPCVSETVVLNHDVSDNESPCVSETCTDEESTGTLSVSPEETTEQTDAGMEMLLEMTERLLQAEVMLSITREELVKTSDELSQVKSQLTATNEHLAKAQEELAEVKKENTRLQSENSRLCKRVVSEQVLRKDEKMVKYYTGLPSYDLLKAICELVTTDVPTDIFSGCACSPFQQFLIVLMKLRLNLGDQDLAYRFGIHQSTVSRYFNKWLDILYHKLSVFVSWPEREQLLKTMPGDFRKHFGKCAIIIDCFEIFIERPTSLMARAQTWSNYKKHNTVKFLIGITPQGTIGFISNGWGGRASDVYITEHSGLLRHLLPGDVVLADRGFNIQEAAGMYCAEVKIPPFTKGKKQLSKMEVDTARRLSSIRIHVERVIGVIRQKYTILQSTLPINMIMCGDDSELSAVDKMVTVACALCNHCDSVIPFD